MKRGVVLLMIDLTSFQFTEKPFKSLKKVCFKKSDQALSVGIFFLPLPVELTTRWLLWRLVCSDFRLHLVYVIASRFSKYLRSKGLCSVKTLSKSIFKSCLRISVQYIFKKWFCKSGNMSKSV